MITGFEKQTHDLTDEEKVLLPQFVAGLKTKIGKKNAITNGKMRQGFEKKGVLVTDARTRKIINHIRITGLVPLLCSTSKGYFVAQTREEIELYLQGLKERIEAQTAVYDALEYQMNREFKN